MVVLILEKVPASLRGELTRWMLEPKAGVFVGKVSGIVREKLWAKTRAKARGGAAMLLYTAQTEQGFAVRSFGDTSRVVVTLDGLTLIRRPAPDARSADAPASDAGAPAENPKKEE